MLFKVKTKYFHRCGSVYVSLFLFVSLLVFVSLVFLCIDRFPVVVVLASVPQLAPRDIEEMLQVGYID